MIKTIRLKKAHYSDLVLLLRDAELVSGKFAFPERIFVNKKTLDKMRREITKAYKNEYKFVLLKKLKTSVAYYMLNLSPVENNAVKDGYAIVIEKE